MWIGVAEASSTACSSSRSWSLQSSGSRRRSMRFIGIASPEMLTPGDTAPDFELPDQDGNPVRLSDLQGPPVVPYFYPKADAPGGTPQARGVGDHRAGCETAAARLLGVSPDPVYTAQKSHDE